MPWYVWIIIIVICLGALIFLLTPVCSWIKKKWKNYRPNTYCKHSTIIDGTRDFHFVSCKKKCKLKNKL